MLRSCLGLYGAVLTLGRTSTLTLYKANARTVAKLASSRYVLNIRT